jgi:hypothetical protein
VGIRASSLLAAELDRLAAGLLFTSESDYPYFAFVVALDPSTPLTLELLQRVLPWREAPGDQPQWQPPPLLRLDVSADDSFWLEEAERDPYYGSEFLALDQRMTPAFIETSIGSGRAAITARIFSVTLPEPDASLAPFFVLGRLKSGEIVGLRTFRVWT